MTNFGSSQFPGPPDPFGPANVAADDAKARSRLKVAGILIIISAGLDFLWGLITVGIGILLVSGEGPREITREFRDFPGGAQALGGVYIAFGVIAPLAAIIKLIGGIKMVRASRGAFGWGLVASILSCVQIWCSLFCILPLGIGIFSIVVLSQENTRRYLRGRAEGG